MAILATLFFAAALGLGLSLVASMLAANSAAIVRALRMEVVAEAQPTPPAARVTRVRRSIRTRSAVASAQWRAAA